MSSVLVVYASKHGATQEIAERIAERLAECGEQAVATPVGSVDDLRGYDALVIGSAAYLGSWLKEATTFVRRHQAELIDRPVWLFSSGPLGTETHDAEGHDVRAAAEPKEFAELEAAIAPRGRRVFFGALSPAKSALPERFLRMLPAGRRLLPEGDFRDWNEIDAWADSIAQELAPVPAGTT